MATMVQLVEGGTLSVKVLREMFRNLVTWRALYEAQGLDEIVRSDGTRWLLWDVLYLYEQVPGLPRRQAQAIELCLIQNMKESDAAVVMGFKHDQPVAMYATGGLRRLVNMVNTGALERYRDRQTSEAC